MSRKLFVVVTLLVAVMVVTACGPAATPVPPTKAPEATKPPVPAPYEKAEPTYHNISFDASSNDDRGNERLM